MSTFSKILLVVVLSVWILGLFSPSTTVIDNPEPARFSVEKTERGDKIPTVTTKNTVTQYLLAVANENGIKRDLFIRTAFCESGFNVWAFNPLDIDGKEKFSIWQYDRDTFAERLRRYNLEGDI